MRTLVFLVYRSMRQNAVATWITAFSIALAAGLLTTVKVVQSEASSAFTQMNSGFDGVLGARGSKLQLVLNALFHLEASPGNVSAEDFEQIRSHPAVARAVPLAVGDNFRGWRIAGTTPDFFTGGEFAPGRSYVLATGGHWFEPGKREAVVGAAAARSLGWKLGSTFQAYHGVTFNPDAKHEEVFTVVGVLEATGTPVDRVIWVSLEGVQTMGGHDPRAASELSAVLVKLKSPSAGFMLDMRYNRQGNRLTFAQPVSAILADLFAKFAWFDGVLSLVAALVALVAAGAVLASIYNSMAARRRDIAILRALGARRRLVFGVVVAEAAAIGSLGAFLGLFVHASLLTVAAVVIREQTGVVVEVLRWHPAIGWTPLAMILLAALGGVVPAMKAYRTSVADSIVPTS